MIIPNETISIRISISTRILNKMDTLFNNAELV